MHTAQFYHFSGSCNISFPDPENSDSRISATQIYVRPGDRGRAAPKSRAAQLAGLVGFIRRKLSICTARQTSRLLLDRLLLLGDGLAEAGAWRDLAARVEVEASRESRAQEVCARQGKGVARRGFGLL